MADGERLRREHNERAWLAWHIAALQRAKKLPTLRQMTVREPRRQPQSWQEQLAIAKQLTIMFGGKIVKKTP